MKKMMALFLVLALACAAFITAAGSYTHGLGENLTLTGEVLAGSRDSARGVTVTQQAVLSRHLAWELEYSPEPAGRTLAYGWSFPELSLYESSAAPEPAIGVYLNGLNTGYSSDAPIIPDENDSALIREIYDYIVPRMDANGRYNGTIDLSDVTDVLPLEFELSGLSDVPRAGVTEDASAVFRVPVPEGLMCRVEYTVQDGMYHFETYTDGEQQIGINCSSVYTDGSVYFALRIFTAGGEAMDASGVPGGSWGVYRIPLRPDGESYMPDPDAAELVYGVGSEAASMQLRLSGDGGSLLLYTAEDGVLYLNVLDLNGTLRQRLELLRSPDCGLEPDALSEELRYPLGLSEYRSGGFTVLNLHTAALVLSGDGGEYSVVLSADLSELPVPGRYADEDEWYLSSSGSRSFVTDGERLVMLDTGEAVKSRYSADDPVVRDGYQRLSVFDGSGLIYCEWLDSQFNEVNYSPWIPSMMVRFTVSIGENA